MMSMSDREPLERIRKAGVLRFALVQGLLIRGGLVFVVALFLERIVWREGVDLRMIASNTVWLLGGLISSLSTWDTNESIRSNRLLNEQIESGDLPQHTLPQHTH
jgi:hypothetical protein